MNGIKICGTGHSVPAKVVTNEDMARIVETNDEWITSRTGIKNRHHCTTETHADLCLDAAKQALEKAGISPDEIGACIVATCTAETVVPSAACTLQRDLGLPTDIPCFDLSAACTGFLFSLHTMECLLRAAPRPYGLVIGCEVLTRVTDWTDRSTCILFGDGAGAAVVEYNPSYPSICAEMGTHGNDQLLKIPGVETGIPSKLTMQGTKVFQFAVKAVPYCIDKVLEKAGKTMDDVDFFVFHQANGRIIDNVVRKYHIPEEKYYKNINEYGNTSAASIPIVISELVNLGKIGSGSRVLCVGFGGGLTWGGALVEFA
ncbi:MAG: beta-ketoacyl-ACP synthase III [Oscillospiraceae bacterium]|jgi:3-oxoacyl-[acyl-carrier-protein] synthase-3